MTNYLLDTNIFIQAKNQHYGFDFCPAFWDWLVRENRTGKVASIQAVANELRRGDDDLVAWARERGGGFFLKPDANVAEALGQVGDWVMDRQKAGRYTLKTVRAFLSGADCQLVAHALAHRFTVVTHETADDESKKIKIPNACAGFELSCVDPYAMLRHEGARFVLGPG